MTLLGTWNPARVNSLHAYFHILLFLHHPVGPVQMSAAIKQVSKRISLDISADLIKLLLWFSLSIGKHSLQVDKGPHY